MSPVRDARSAFSGGYSVGRSGLSPESQSHAVLRAHFFLSIPLCDDFSSPVQSLLAHSGEGESCQHHREQLQSVQDIGVLLAASFAMSLPTLDEFLQPVRGPAERSHMPYQSCQDESRARVFRRWTSS